MGPWCSYFQVVGLHLGYLGYYEVSLSLSWRREAGFLALMGSKGRQEFFIIFLYLMESVFLLIFR